jgi:hypothetical protein
LKGKKKWSGKVQRDPSKIQQWWDQSGKHGDVCTKCGEKMDIMARSIGIPLKSNSKWDQSGRWSLMSNSTKIEFGWNHVMVSTTICCSATTNMFIWFQIFLTWQLLLGKKFKKKVQIQKKC